MRDELEQLMSSALSREDAAGAVFFRVAFGGIATGWAWDYLTTGRVTRLYVAPEFHFTYPGFEWLAPWPGVGMYIHFLVMLILGLLIAVGWRYRLVTTLFAICFTYFFLLERTNYQNHYYLLCLVSWLMPLLPLNRMLSLDARRQSDVVIETVPRWVYWALQFHVAVPYFFGGLAKLTADWMLGQPMGMFLQTKAELPLVGSWLGWQPLGVIFSWYGLFFDLLVVPALLWKRTRVLAFLLCIAFHLGNAALFQIHVFPWFMIAATTVFFEPDWPRRLLGGKPLSSVSSVAVGDMADRSFAWTWPRRFALTLAALYVLFHCLWPLRSRLYGEETSWTERAHLFSWRMMLRAKEVGIGYAVIDPVSGKLANVNHKQFIDDEQSEKFARDPELILRMAHFIADKFEQEIGGRPEVYAFVLTSLNGRKPQLMIDPNTNLAVEPLNSFTARPWILPLNEPFRSVAWDIPVEQWREHVELPEIKFLRRSTLAQPNASAVESGADPSRSAVESSGLEKAAAASNGLDDTAG